MKWTTPDSTILKDTPDIKPSMIYKGQDIASFITQGGVECEFVTEIAAPQITTYHFNLANIFEFNKLKKIIKSLSAALHTYVTQATSDIAHFSIVIPNSEKRIVTLKECMMTKTFNNHDRYLRSCLGMDCFNKPLVLSVNKMPHILVAGATGSGKSVLLNSMIVSMLFSNTPNNLKFVMIDPKKVELSKYDGLPHLITPVIKDYNSAISTLKEVCEIMDDRYERMSNCGFKNGTEAGFPALVVVIDELADLMLTSKYECEESIIRIAQLGRAASIHLIIATQRPTVNVVTGLIKSNIPCKIALQTSSIRDSITILDHKGAETLTGKGDAYLKLPDQVNEIRFQSAFITDKDIDYVVDYWINDSVTE